MKTFKFTLFAGAVALILMVTACNSKPQNEAFQEAFSIGKMSVSKFMLLLHVEDRLEYYKKQNVEFTRAELNEAVKSIVNRFYLLYTARAHGYHRDEEVNKKAETFTRHIALQYFSFNDEEESFLNPSESEVKEAYGNVSKELFFKYLLFQTKTEAQEVVGELSGSSEKFNAYYEKADSADKGKDVLFFPFFNYYMLSEDILALPVNEVSGALENYNQYYIVVVDSARNYQEALKPYEAIKKGLTNHLKDVREQHIWKTRYNTYSEKSELVINAEQVNQLLEYPQVFKKKGEQKLVFDIITEDLATYKVGNKNVEISLEDYFEFVNSYWGQIRIETPNDVEASIRRMITEEIIYDELKTGSKVKQDTFLYEMQDYKDELVINKFLMEEIRKKVEITPQEVRSIYETEKSKYHDGEYVVVTIADFITKEEAIACYNKLSGLSPDTLDLFGLDILKQSNPENLMSKHKVKFNDTNYPKQLMTRLFGQKDNHVLKVAKSGDNFRVYVKHHELGDRIKSYEEVNRNIQGRLYEEKVSETIKNTIKELKEKKPIHMTYTTDSVADFLNVQWEFN